MKKLTLLLSVIVMLAVSCTTQSKKESSSKTEFTITGKNWDKFNGDLIKVLVRDTSISRTKFLATTTIKDGKFKLSGNIKFPQNAKWAIYDQNGGYKGEKGLLVAEAESFNIDFREDGISYDNTYITGGKYNKIIYSDVLNSTEMVKARAAYYEFSSKMTNEDRLDKAKSIESQRLFAVFMEVRDKKYLDILNQHENPFVRMLAIDKSGFKTNPTNELNQLENELGLTPEIINLRKAVLAIFGRQKISESIKVGSTIKDFSALDLQGNKKHLAEELKANKFVLVEFWASWCAPCRAEIPHMKEAYKRFKSEKFEIVSFSLDHEKKKWEKASLKEQLPWVNLSDLKAYKSPIAEMYGVTAVPANYLVDSKGKVVGKNVRGEDLTKKLEELLGK